MYGEHTYLSYTLSFRYTSLLFIIFRSFIYFVYQKKIQLYGITKNGHKKSVNTQKTNSNQDLWTQVDLNSP